MSTMPAQRLRHAAQYEVRFALWTFTFHGNATQQTEPGHLGPAQTSPHAIKSKYFVSQEGFAAIRLFKLSKILEVAKQFNLKTWSISEVLAMFLSFSRWAWTLLLLYMTRDALQSALSEFKPSGFVNVMKIRESTKSCEGGWKSNDVIRKQSQHAKGRCSSSLC